MQPKSCGCQNKSPPGDDGAPTLALSHSLLSEAPWLNAESQDLPSLTKTDVFFFQRTLFIRLATKTAHGLQDTQGGKHLAFHCCSYF